MTGPFLSNEVNAVVGRYFEQPGGKCKIGCVLIDVFKSLSKCFDGKILSIHRAVYHF